MREPPVSLPNHVDHLVPQPLVAAANCLCRRLTLEEGVEGTAQRIIAGEVAVDLGQQLEVLKSLNRSP